MYGDEPILIKGDHEPKASDTFQGIISFFVKLFLHSTLS